MLHSHLSDGERHDEWHKIREGRARIVIGARSAVFAPVEPLGLIIVDEEHEHSYKQEEAPRYHARDVAVVRAQKEGAVVVLGSATPSLETYHHAKAGHYQLLKCPRERMIRVFLGQGDGHAQKGAKGKGIPILSQQQGGHRATIGKKSRRCFFESTRLCFLSAVSWADSLRVSSMQCVSDLPSSPAALAMSSLWS